MRCPPNGELFWGPFYPSTSYGLWTCEYQGVADQEVLSIVEMTLTFKGDRQPVWGSAARLRLVTSRKRHFRRDGKPICETKTIPTHHTPERNARRRTWQIGWREKQRQLPGEARGSDWRSRSGSHRRERTLRFNNAGLERHADFWDATEEDYDAVLNVNLKGLFFITQAFVKHRMRAKAGGKVINISSVHEELPFPHFTSYCASKGGVKMLTRNLSIELAPFGITINNIAPGAIETPINTKLLNDPVKLNALLGNIPLKRLGKPEDVASMAAFLASSESDYATGATFFVDGGLTWNYQEQ